MESQRRRIIPAQFPSKGAIEMGAALGEDKCVWIGAQRADEAGIICKNRIAGAGCGQAAAGGEAGAESPTPEQTLAQPRFQAFVAGMNTVVAQQQKILAQRGTKPVVQGEYLVVGRAQNAVVTSVVIG